MISKSSGESQTSRFARRRAVITAQPINALRALPVGRIFEEKISIRSDEKWIKRTNIIAADFV